MKKVNISHKMSPWTPVSRIMPDGKPTSLPFPVQAMAPKYCKKCGQPLLYCATDKNGMANNTLEEEMALGVCHECYPDIVKIMEEQMRKAAEEAQKAVEPTEEEKQLADEKYEEAIKKYMEELKNKSGHNT